MIGHFDLGVRSLNFISDIMTVGTGAGSIFFYDLKAGKYLELNCSHPCSLSVGKGWLVIISFTFNACQVY